MGDVSRLVEWIALALPFAALVTMIVLALRQTRRRRAASSCGRYGAPVREPAPASKVSVPTREPEPAPGPDPTQQGQRAPAPLPDPSALEAAVAKGEADGDTKHLAVAYLALARHRIAGGDGPAAADLLRKTIRAAASSGQKGVHAEARLELGDICQQQGDLTTACEHWQIARGLFHELASAASLAGAERRMRQNGCPTDWVLNDF
jgi:hypothetical protein